MINLRHRSYQKELMDGDDISFADMAQTLKELNIINTRLGGHAITLRGLKRFISNKEPMVVCEIGCGGGDNRGVRCSSTVDRCFVHSPGLECVEAVAGVSRKFGNERGARHARLGIDFKQDQFAFAAGLGVVAEIGARHATAAQGLMRPQC